MYGPLVRDLLGLKELAYELVRTASVQDNTGTAAVDRAALAALIESLDQLARHADAEAAWRISSQGQIANLVMNPFYGPRRRVVE